jgi:hypothetical protein
MNISLDTLSRLNANRSYYLSDEGTIEKTGPLQWFKCVTGWGDGRAKAQRLAQAVKQSLLASAGIANDATLNSDIERFNGATYSLSGASLSGIANRFKAAHSEAINKNELHREAYAIAEEAADAEIKEWRKGERVVNDPNKPESLGYVRKIALYSVQHIMLEAAENPDLLKNREGFKRKMRTRMFLTIDAINAAEIAQRQRSGLGFPKSRVNGKSEMGFARFEFDELHFRAVLAALITKDGPVKMADFVQRLSIYQEDILQERKDALLKTTLEPPSVPWSGFAFAESAAHIYKAMEDSEWHRVSAE